MKKKTVLFICTHNSARSQMAEGLVNGLHGDRYAAYSAGTEKTGVNPYAVRAMRNMGIDISQHRSKSVEEFRERTFDIVVTVCDSARESCPFSPGKKVIHNSFTDPSSSRGSDEEILMAFENTRDEIRAWIEAALLV